MAINITTSMTLLGRIGKLLLLSDQHAAALPTAIDGLFDLFTGYTDRLITADALNSARVAPRVPAAYLPTYQALAQEYLLFVVRADAPASAVSVGAALTEFRRQMIAQSETVKRSTIGATVTALSPATGNGVVVTTTLRPDGLPAELAIPETAQIVITADSYSQLTTAGAEQAIFVSADSSQGGGPGDYLYYAWPSGSGVSTQFNVVAADAEATATTNLLTDGQLEDWTGAVPDNWVTDVGAANLSKATTNLYGGSAAALVTGGVAEVRITNALAAGLLAPLTSYACVIRTRIDTSPAAGTFTVELTDSSGTVLTDAEGASNTSSVDLTLEADGSYVTQKIVFRTGRSVPSGGGKLRLRTLSLSGGSTLRIDECVLTPMVYPYAGSIGIAVVGGSTAFATGDRWNLAVTNNRGGASNNATFQALFERLFGMTQFGLVLPSDASPTQADTLITS